MIQGQGQKLYLKIPCREDPRMRKVELVLSMFPGDSQAVLYFEDTKSAWAPPVWCTQRWSMR